MENIVRDKRIDRDINGNVKVVGDHQIAQTWTLFRHGIEITFKTGFYGFL